MRPEVLYVSPSKWACIKSGKVPIEYIVTCPRETHERCRHTREIRETRAELLFTALEDDALKARKQWKCYGPVNVFALIDGTMLQAIFLPPKKGDPNAFWKSEHKGRREKLNGWRMTEASAEEWRRLHPKRKRREPDEREVETDIYDTEVES